jgi:ATP-binding cassette subfamily F protein 3
VERLATKIIEIGHGQALVYPGTYPEFLWHKEHPEAALGSGHSARGAQGPRPKAQGPKPARSPEPGAQSRGEAPPAPSRDERKRVEAERRKQQKARDALLGRIATLEARIAEREAEVKELEAAMAAPGFFEDRDAARPIIDRHQALMWEVGDLMSQWEALQEHAES